MKQSRHRTAARQPDTWTDKQTGSETVGDVVGGLRWVALGGWESGRWGGARWSSVESENNAWPQTAVQGGDRLPSVCADASC